MQNLEVRIRRVTCSRKTPGSTGAAHITCPMPPTRATLSPIIPSTIPQEQLCSRNRGRIADRRVLDQKARGKKHTPDVHFVESSKKNPIR